MQLLSVKQIWNKGKHNAFTDLCQFNNNYYCCFREAKAHISDKGVIRVLQSKDLTQWSLVSTIRENNHDLRDPHLSVTPDNQLLINFGAVYIDKDKKRSVMNTMISRSCDGITWSAKQIIGEDSWWIWRLSWFQKQAFGISYAYGPDKVKLYQGLPGRTFEVTNEALFSKDKYGKGYPNESDILFLDDNTAICVLRRDADTATAQLGRSNFPFTQWHWHDLGEYVGGPALILTPNNQIILAGRSWSKYIGCKTAIWQVDLDNNQIVHQLTLPSAKDTSYPGLVIREKQLFVSYYSEHINNKASIYLAQIALEESTN